jgi:hypothetical protein
LESDVDSCAGSPRGPSKCARRDNQILRDTTIPDLPNHHRAKLIEVPDSNTMVLWLDAGQDRQRSYLLTDDGFSISHQELDSGFLQPSDFLPGTNEYLHRNDDLEISHLVWGSQHRLGELVWLDVEPDSPAIFSSDIHLLPGGYFSASSTSGGAVHIIDLTTMDPVDTVRFAGHSFATDEYGLIGSFIEAAAGPDDALLARCANGALLLTSARDWSPDPDRITPGPTP